MTSSEDPTETREESDPNPDSKESGADSKEKKPFSKKTVMLCSLAIASVVLQLASVLFQILFSGSFGFLCYIASGIALIVGVLVLFRQFFVMENLDSMEDIQNQLKATVDGLKGENNVLTGNVDELTTQNDRLKESEKALGSVTGSQGANIDKLLGALKENKVILNMMEKRMEQKLIQMFYQVIIRCDTNGDMQIEDKELDVLALRMSNILGIVIHTDLFVQKALEFGGSLDQLFEYIQQVLQGNIIEENPCFEVDTKALKEEMG